MASSTTIPTARSAWPNSPISWRGAPAIVRRFCVSCSSRASRSDRSKCSSVGKVAASRAIRTPSTRLTRSVSSVPSVPLTMASTHEAVNSTATGAAPNAISPESCAIVPSITSRRPIV
ncbi:MAG TPA: hypothetical protein VEF89_05400 [Solirubrobacteraceae bacterium]|nr:hypothetical protein [Solirubrobacteraceae bacterium]